MINNANDLICIFMNFNENTKTIEKKKKKKKKKKKTNNIKTISEIISYLNYHCDTLLLHQLYYVTKLFMSCIFMKIILFVCS